MPIRFLALPLLVQQNVLHKVELNDYVKLSLLSRRTEKLLRVISRRVNYIHWEFLRGAIKISLVPGEKVDDLAGQIVFYLPKRGKYPSGSHIDFKGVRLVLSDSKWSGYRSVKAHAHHVAGHLLKVLRIQKHALTIPERKHEMLTIWKYSKTFDRVTIGSDLVDVKISLKPSIVKMFLEQGESMESLFLSVDMKPNFKFTGPLKQKNIEIRNPAWLDFDSVLNSESCTIAFSNHRPSISEMKQFIQKWVSGDGLKNLESFLLVHDEETPDIFSQDEGLEILKDVDSFDWDPANRPEFYICPADNSRIKFENGKDVRRVTDGRIATCDVFHGNWEFTVWPLDQLNMQE